MTPPPPRRGNPQPRRDGRPPADRQSSRRAGNQPGRQPGDQPGRQPGGQPRGQGPRQGSRSAARGPLERAPRPGRAVARVLEPELPDEVSGRELDRDTRAELRSLPESLAEKVARHLVAAGRTVDDDPDRARAHAWFARKLAPRLAAVREAAGVTAYAAGDYAAALAELRAVRRMTGDASSLPLMADCERGLGRPERALALARDPDVKKLDPAAKIELGIVVSGARRDRGEFEAAVVALQGPALDSEQLQPWTPRLWYAYADALLAADRRDDALRWFESVAAIDEAGETDAADRAAELGAR